MSNEHKIEYIAPTRLVWQSGNVYNPELLLQTDNGHIVFSNSNVCRMQNHGDIASILLDFGRELHGSVQLRVTDTTDNKPVRIRIRLGESVSEAMSELGGKGNATNDHAIRDQMVKVPWMGSFQTSQSGFRFVRIDILDSDTFLCLAGVQALFVFRDIPYRGSFSCNDERLNSVWSTGAYTVHLNMQEYLWDGIKRDRLVWVGDIHPEIMTINSVFGFNKVVPESLDLMRDTTELPEWMNGISSYSLWWILAHHCWFQYSADLNYLMQQKDYLLSLLEILFQCVGKDGGETLTGHRFLDWPSSSNKIAIHAGLHSLLLMALDRSAELCELLGDADMAGKCTAYVKLMRDYIPDPNGSKQAGALMVLAGIADAREMTQRLLQIDGCRNMSTFYGYYVLQAMARAGAIDKALDIINRYWGGMLDLGATTFWEEFNIDWTENAARIDEITPPEKKDIHADFGEYCYKGLRQSLCHGWASGPTAWLSEHILGIKPLEVGFKKVEVRPKLGRLKWVEGVFPTCLGDIKVQHENKGSKVVTDIQVPPGIEVVSNESKATTYKDVINVETV